MKTEMIKVVKPEKYTQVKFNFKNKTKFILKSGEDVLLKGESKEIIITLPVGEYSIVIVKDFFKKEIVRFLLFEDRCEIIS